MNALLSELYESPDMALSELKQVITRLEKHAHAMTPEQKRELSRLYDRLERMFGRKAA